MWFRKDKTPRPVRDHKSTSLGEGLFLKCDGCRETLYSKEVERNQQVCPKCQHHFTLSADARMKLLFDEERFQPLFGEVRPTDPLKFKDSKRYRDRLKEYESRTGRPDAIVAGTGTLEGHPVVVAVLDYAFIGGSMGSAVGEVVTRCVELSLHERRPLIIVSASGGARMQEGILSLMQMAKVSAALAKLAEGRVPYISVLTNPTTGGVTASFAMQGDVILAEPKALVGFAGPRVIEQTIRQTLPEGFQRSEFLRDHGFVDAVVPRPQLKATIGTLLSLFGV
ncbi:MAG TPA: acetyl-CoA carboxylase, carboxyltransferase subunit beta [Thermoanaerobaculia bacterium]|nr:acetyl-CoA carboxylase, carboxyltransferase subunit beta [Thermoanaerobaculia bacterium]